MAIFNWTQNIKKINSLTAVFHLSVGMMCAVRFSADQLFYRAEVLSVVDANNIDVKYVDYGNVETVSVQRIRKLLDVYSVLTVQVM